LPFSPASLLTSAFNSATLCFVGAHRNFQPAICSIEHQRAKVERDGEQPIRDGDGGIGKRPGEVPARLSD
jgi:hypothetical protein